jgi:hypothetical protein
MKYALFTLVFPLFLAGSSSKQANAQKPAGERVIVSLKPVLRAHPTSLAPEAAGHYMERAWYEYGTSQSPPPAAPQNEFVVVADVAREAKNFVSSSEQWLRQRLANRANPTALYPWRELTAQQRQTRLKEEQKAYRQQADSLHTVNNNKGNHLVWLVNNSADVITIGTQDASLFCVLQAQDKEKQWQPIQYWQFSKCGNSYIAQFLLPKERICFLAKSRQQGNFKTKLRYKIAGLKQFYYSNEFDGRIDYNEFTERPFSRPRLVAGKPVAAFKLDSLPRTNYFGHIAFHYQPKGAW